MKSRAYALSVCLLACSLAAGAQETVAFKISPPAGKTRLAGIFKFKLEASFPEKYSIRPDTSSAADSDFEIISFTKAGENKGGGLKTTGFEIKAQAFSLGISTFPALTWKLYETPAAQGMEAKSPSFTMEVLPVFESKEGEGIRDIRPPFRYIPWLWLLAGLLAAAAVFFALRRFWAGAALPAGAAWADGRTPYQRARARLDGMEKSGLAAAGRIKEYYIGLTSVLRFYLAEEFSISAELMTTSDLSRELKRTGAPIKTTLGAREFLQKADLVKFARMKPEDAAADARALDDLLMEFTRTAENNRAKAAAAAALTAAKGKAA